MSEAEFWRYYVDKEQKGQNNEPLIDIENQVVKNIDSRQIIQAGISNKPFVLIPRQNNVNQKIQYSLEE